MRSSTLAHTSKWIFENDIKQSTHQWRCTHTQTLPLTLSVSLHLTSLPFCQSPLCSFTYSVYPRVLQPSRYLPRGTWDELNSNTRYQVEHNTWYQLSPRPRPGTRSYWLPPPLLSTGGYLIRVVCFAKFRLISFLKIVILIVRR